MTVQQVFDITMAIIDSISSEGVPEPSDYAGKAPSMMTIIQTEIADIEGLTPVPIESMDDNLVISEKACMMVAPYGLAAHLMLCDMNDSLHKYFSQRYELLKPKLRLKATTSKIIDVYGGE